MSFLVYSYFLFFGVLCLILVRKHILLCLLCLEFIVLYLLFMLFVYCLMYDFSFYLYVLLMTFYVCEGVLGLGVLVLMIRTHGNDYLSSMSMW